jgi:hypothetical protein
LDFAHESGKDTVIGSIAVDPSERQLHHGFGRFVFGDELSNREREREI